jgi:twitching motility protein PilT
VRNLIRKNELQQIYSVIQTSSKEHMQTMNGCLLKLFQEGKISLEEAMLFTTRQQELEQLIARSPVSPAVLAARRADRASASEPVAAGRS